MLEKKQSKMDFNDSKSLVEKGLQVVYSKYERSENFTWDLFEGYDRIRVLTYSSSIDAVVRMLDRFSFQNFECVFGFEGILGKLTDVITFQQFVMNQVRDFAIQIKDDRQKVIFEKVHSDMARFFVVKDRISHSKIFLLENETFDRRRVITGSVNLSERAFSGNQAETIIVYDDDDKAWEHYSSEYEAVKSTSSDKIDFPADLVSRQVEFTETPLLQDTGLTVFQQEPVTELTIPNVLQKVEALSLPIERVVGPQIVRKAGKFVITPSVKAEIKRLRWKKQGDENQETTPTNLSISRETKSVTLSGSKIPLEVDEKGMKSSAEALIEYFTNYEMGFVGDVGRLQRQYFMFMSWLYASPFICDLRSSAIVSGGNVFHYPSFAVIFGKSNCGKTSLVETLMTSMFGHAHSVQKDSFTRGMLRGIQQNYGRFPVVFDDISRKRFTDHGLDIIKDENLPALKEHPSFILSMNAEPQSFPDEVMKRCLMIYANTSLPNHDHALTDKLHRSVESIRRRLTTDFYKCYMDQMMDRLSEENSSYDILLSSSGVICRLLEQHTSGPLPEWCRPVTWNEYADQRYERQVKRLRSLLADENYRHSVSEGDQGWTLKTDNVFIWEKADLFGRKSIKGEIPDFLYDDDASVGDLLVLSRHQTEDFLGIKIRKPSRRWLWK